MGNTKWLKENKQDLSGKTVAVTGATGGLGQEICRAVLAWGGRLILVARSRDKVQNLQSLLLQDYPEGQIRVILGDLLDPAAVRDMARKLAAEPLDILVLNAGGYCLPRTHCATGFDPVFQINFVSQYYLARTLLPLLQSRHGRIVATGSIAHSGCETDPGDLDFSAHTSPEEVYGNSKRYLMFSLMELIKENPGVQLAVAHPGISFTGITSHYPEKWLGIVKCSMLLLFMHPPKAARSIIRGLYEDVPDGHWIGPKIRDIWGEPVISALDSCSSQERERIYRTAEEIYSRLSGGSASGSTPADDPAAPSSAEAGDCG